MGARKNQRGQRKRREMEREISLLERLQPGEPQQYDGDTDDDHDDVFLPSSSDDDDSLRQAIVIEKLKERISESKARGARANAAKSQLRRRLRCVRSNLKEVNKGYKILKKKLQRSKGEKKNWKLLRKRNGRRYICWRDRIESP
jgi:DNA repair exonuclease SbcCD ATPase subunit